MKKFLIILVVIVAGIFIWKYSNKNTHPSVPTSTTEHLPLAGEEKNSNTVTINNKTFNVTLAKTDSERQKGLSGVAHLEKNSGMIFIFDKLDTHGFWMKDTLIPLDIIWLAPSKVEGIDTLEIVFIQKNVTPDTFPTVFTPNTPAMYVLELNSGISDEFNFKIGDEVLFSTPK